jgi:hypothetical protein
MNPIHKFYLIYWIIVLSGFIVWQWNEFIFYILKAIIKRKKIYVVTFKGFYFGSHYYFRSFDDIPARSHEFIDYSSDSFFNLLMELVEEKKDLYYPSFVFKPVTNKLKLNNEFIRMFSNGNICIEIAAENIIEKFPAICSISGVKIKK